MEEVSAETDNPPEEYVCPITKDLMVRPVMLLSDGTTYEERALGEWLKENNTSPLTGLELTTKETKPNYNLRQAIETYKKGRLNKDSEMVEFLTKHKLEDYVSMLILEGFQDMNDLSQVTFADLIAMDMPRGHARRLLQQLS
ncbi:protein kinase family protein, partial [Reticulomyxa filosa]